MALLAIEPASGFDENPSEGIEEFYQRTGRALDNLQAISDRLPDGEYRGAVLSFPIGDGSALYLVQKTEPLTLQHIPYGDGYCIPGAHVRGLDLDDVKAQVRYNKKVRR